MPNTAQVLRGAPAVISFTLLDQNGLPRLGTDVTATVTRADGSILVADAATVTTLNPGEVTLPLSAADTASLDHLVVTWSESGGGIFETIVEVVGGYFFTIEEARLAGPNFSDAQKYPDELLIAARRAVEEECERITGRSFVPRHRRVVLSGNDRQTIPLPHPDVRSIRSLVAAGYEYFVDSLVIGVAGSVTSPLDLFPYGTHNMVVEYEYGLDAPPQRIKEAALLRFRDALARKKTGPADRATFQIVEGKIFNVPQPGVRGSRTGIPEVDQAYDEWSFRRGTVGSIPIT